MGSGALDSVGSMEMAKSVRIRETAASRAGMIYRAATGTPLVNQGEKMVQGITDEGKE